MAMLNESEVKKLREIMDNFINIGGSQHPETRLDRIELKLERLTEGVQDMRISLSNAQLVQRGVLWLGGIIGSSAVVMAMTFLFKG